MTSSTSHLTNPAHSAPSASSPVSYQLPGQGTAWIWGMKPHVKASSQETDDAQTRFICTLTKSYEPRLPALRTRYDRGRLSDHGAGPFLHAMAALNGIAGVHV